MSWEKYLSSVEEYLLLDNRYDVRFDYIDGRSRLRDGTRVVLLGGPPAVERSPGKAMVVIADATQEEVEQLAAFVASLRSRKKVEGE